MTEQIYDKISYMMLTLNEILIEIEKSETCKNLTFLGSLKKYILNGTDFPVAWKKAVSDADLPLKKQELDRLLQLGASLGYADSAVQQNILKVYSSYFLSCQKASDKQKEKYAVTAMLSGVLCGSAVFILFI